MLKRIRNCIRTIMETILYGSKRSSASYIRYLQKQGVTVGKGTVLYEPLTNVIDTTSPKLLKIGEYVRITRGVVILTHDYSWSVLAGVYGECLGGVAPVTIGNNVFIGMDAHIMKGVEIGDNVIIGAGSIVTKSCESNSVYAGNPARKIMTLEECYQKRKERNIYEPSIVAERFMDEPEEVQRATLREFCCLYSSLEDEQMQKLMADTGYSEICKEYYKKNPQQYESMQAFLKSVE